MAPDQAAKINEMMAKRPPVVTSTVVEKIETKKLAESDFAIPERLHQARTADRHPMKPGAMKMAPPAARTGIAGSALRRSRRLARIDTTGESELKKRAGSVGAPLVVSIDAKRLHRG